jgi:hypothetical protein
VDREWYARRAFFAAWLGLPFPPLAFVALYFVLNAAFGSGPLSGRGRFNTVVAACMTAPGLLLGWFYCGGFR